MTRPRLTQQAQATNSHRRVRPQSPVPRSSRRCLPATFWCSRIVERKRFSDGPRQRLPHPSWQPENSRQCPSRTVELRTRNITTKAIARLEQDNKAKALSTPLLGPLHRGVGKALRQRNRSWFVDIQTLKGPPSRRFTTHTSKLWPANV